MSVQAFAARLLERAAVAKVDVPVEQIGRLRQYYVLLERWNQRVNLTALPLDGYRPQAVDRLLLEPLAAAPFVEDAPADWVDLGSGGGSPAIPLKIVRPALRLLMTESRERKAAFLREAVRQLGLEDADVLAGRFEVLANREAKSVDLVTARAVRVDEVLSSVVAHILRPGGRFLLFGFRESPLLDSFDVVHVGALPGTESRFGLLVRR